MKKVIGFIVTVAFVITAAYFIADLQEPKTTKAESLVCMPYAGVSNAGTGVRFRPLVKGLYTVTFITSNPDPYVLFQDSLDSNPYVVSVEALKDSLKGKDKLYRYTIQFTFWLDIYVGMGKKFSYTCVF